MSMNMNAVGGISSIYSIIQANNSPPMAGPGANVLSLYYEVNKGAGAALAGALGRLNGAEKMEFFRFSGEFGLPLHIAAAGNYYKLMEELCAGLKSLSDDQKMELLSQEMPGDGSSLCVAAQKGHKGIVVELLKAAPKSRVIELIQQARDDGATPLWLALTDGNSATVTALISRDWINYEQKFDLLMMPGPDDRIPLHIGLDSMDGKQVKNLVRNVRGENIVKLLLARDSAGSQLLHLAASVVGRYEIILQLFNDMNNNDIVKCLNQKRHLDDKTPLLLAVESKDFYFVQQVFTYFNELAKPALEHKESVMKFDGRLGAAVKESSDEIRVFFRALCGGDADRMTRCLGFVVEQPGGAVIENSGRLRRQPRFSANGMNSPDSVHRPPIVDISAAPPRRSKANPEYLGYQVRLKKDPQANLLPHQNAQSSLINKNPSILVTRSLINKPQPMPPVPLNPLMSTLVYATSLASPLPTTAQLMVPRNPLQSPATQSALLAGRAAGPLAGTASAMGAPQNAPSALQPPSVNHIPAARTIESARSRKFFSLSNPQNPLLNPQAHTGSMDSSVKRPLSNSSTSAQTTAPQNTAAQLPAADGLADDQKDASVKKARHGQSPAEHDAGQEMVQLAPLAKKGDD